MDEPIEVEATAQRSVARSLSHGISELLKTALIAGLVFVGARTFVLPYEVEGASMTPNLHDRERVLVNRGVYFHFDLNALLNLLPGDDREGERLIYPFHAPERGDVVVLNPPYASSKPYIKRVIGLPGESIAFRDGYVYVDGRRLDEDYIDGPITDCEGTAYCTIEAIPDGYVYVLGDNRRNSSDSRSFGPVAIEEIVGKAWFSNWPIEDIGLLPSYDYEG